MAKQEGSEDVPRGIQPTELDVLCGKDKLCVNHAGSRRFREVIDSYREKYANAVSKYEKMVLTKEIYETMSQTARFLKYNSKEKVWEEISPMAARDKCGHALRFANRLKSSESKKKKPSLVAARMNGQQDRTGPESPSVSGTAASMPPLAPALPIAPAPPAPAPQLTPHQAVAAAELMKRYDALWGSAQLPGATTTTAAVSAPLPPLAAAQHSAISQEVARAVSQEVARAALAAALPPLMVSYAPAPLAPAVAYNAIPSNTATTAATTSLPSITAASASSSLSSSTATSNSLGQHSQQQAASPPLTTNSSTGNSGAASTRRRPTLDDLCSILNVINGTPI